MTNPVDDDNVVSLDQERVRIRSRQEERNDEERKRLLNTFVDVGRIQINPGGGAVPMRIVECMFCYALILRDEHYRLLTHARWHDDLRRRD